MYHLFFVIALGCFGYHTIIHVLEYFGLFKANERVHFSIGIAMFFGWLSYFYMSFFDPFMTGISAYIVFGVPMLIAGFCLFFESHRKVHKRMHHGKGPLVRDGVYKYLRHPMYLGEILMFLGAPILGGSMLTLMISSVFIMMVLIWRYFEESELMERYPEYEEYRKKTIF
ncbi:MAG: isoprenylcysteine carboxylmethyltransferase family protein [Candidatus Aenigmarchaeota archaeon]|nr:isoprenylcysteine carboxylmethyltransferase family protein [Candidatus Aenigmarchaeota archaeon]